MKVQVKVKQRHINAAGYLCALDVPPDASACPVTLALSELGYQATVFDDRMYVEGFGWGYFSPKVNAWINSWIRDESKVKPFSFTLNVPGCR